MKFLSVFFALVAHTHAHGGVIAYKINGQYMKGFTPYNSPAGQSTIERQWNTFNPIEQPNSASMICNTPGTPAAQIATVAAGSKVTAYWNSYSHDTGPIIVWMTECNTDCRTWDGRGGKWFKINEAGLISGTVGHGRWGSGEMIKGNLTWTVEIPKQLKDGEYLLRHETIAMHSTIPQFYPNCAQIKVTGGGSASPEAKYRTSIPGVYSSNDPAWKSPIWTQENMQRTVFKIPGPPVWKGA